MEYIKKEELKDGDIFVTQLSVINFLNKEGTNYYLMLNKDNSIMSEKLHNTGNFAYDNIRLATPEEKHWLTSCITADKFITFEEAMKTFIPEYVELINTGCRINCNIPAGKIYKCSKDVTKDYHFGFFLDSKHRIGFNENEFDQYLKPSTKEAYDAQFVVKEPEFVLPELWHIIITTENYEILSKYFSNNLPHSVLYTKGIMGFYKENKLGHTHTQIKGYDWDFGIEITFEQFKKYVLKDEIVEKKVIEPLPQFKIIESIETITKVENNEGNQFFIGDEVIGSKTKIKSKIISFKYNVDKTAILAITDKTPNIGIGINHLEHYIEPKVEVEETLLEKSKRLYPIGTKVKTVCFGRVTTIKTDIFHETNHDLDKVIYADNGNISIYSEKENHWATIIE